MTADTSDMLHITLNDNSYLIPKLLIKMKYVLIVELQSDRIEENLAFTES